VSRHTLTLYELDRSALKALSGELKTVLKNNDAATLAALLELSTTVAEDLQRDARLVDRFLLPEEHPRSRVVMASVRRISKKRSMSPVFTSEHLSLEGRLRAYEPLRDDQRVAKLIDKLLDQTRLPWFLRTKNGTGGWLNCEQRHELAAGLRKLRTDLSPELLAFSEGLMEVDGDILAHDAL
jgi:hypothetical protein